MPAKIHDNITPAQVECDNFIRAFNERVENIRSYAKTNGKRWKLQPVKANVKATAMRLVSYYMQDLCRAHNLAELTEDKLPALHSTTRGLATGRECCPRTIQNHLERLQQAKVITNRRSIIYRGLRLYINPEIILKGAAIAAGQEEAPGSPKEAVTDAPKPAAGKEQQAATTARNKQQQPVAIASNGRLQQPGNNSKAGMAELVTLNLTRAHNTAGRPMPKTGPQAHAPLPHRQNLPIIGLQDLQYNIEQCGQSGDPSGSVPEPEASEQDRTAVQAKTTGECKQAGSQLQEETAGKKEKISGAEGAGAAAPAQNTGECNGISGTATAGNAKSGGPDRSFEKQLVLKVWAYARKKLYTEREFAPDYERGVLNLLWSVWFVGFKKNWSPQEWENYTRELLERIEMAYRFTLTRPEYLILPPHLYFGEKAMTGSFHVTDKWLTNSRRDRIIGTVRREASLYRQGKGKFKTHEPLALFKLHEKRLQAIGDEYVLRAFYKLTAKQGFYQRKKGGKA